jgi:hypothetical protein
VFSESDEPLWRELQKFDVEFVCVKVRLCFAQFYEHDFMLISAHRPHGYSPDCFGALAPDGAHAAFMCGAAETWTEFYSKLFCESLTEQTRRVSDVSEARCMKHHHLTLTFTFQHKNSRQRLKLWRKAPHVLEFVQNLSATSHMEQALSCLNHT